MYYLVKHFDGTLDILEETKSDSFSFKLKHRLKYPEQEPELHPTWVSSYERRKNDGLTKGFCVAWISIKYRIIETSDDLEYLIAKATLDML